MLDSNAIPLGMFPVEIQIPEPIALEPGDLFAVISDGIFEASDAAGEEFGVERTVGVLREHSRDATSEILSRIREAVEVAARGS